MRLGGSSFVFESQRWFILSRKLRNPPTYEPQIYVRLRTILCLIQSSFSNILSMDLRPELHTAFHCRMDPTDSLFRDPLDGTELT